MYLVEIFFLLSYNYITAVHKGNIKEYACPSQSNNSHLMSLEILFTANQ